MPSLGAVAGQADPRWSHAILRCCLRDKYVVAIVRPDVVGPLEQRLTQLGIGSITLTRIKGFGEYKNFFTRDWLTEPARMNALRERRARQAARALAERRLKKNATTRMARTAACASSVCIDG